MTLAIQAPQLRLESNLRLHHSSSPSLHKSFEKDSQETWTPNTFPAYKSPHQSLFLGGTDQVKSFSRSFAHMTSNSLSCLNTYTRVIHFSPLDYVVSYHFTCLCVLSNHVRAGLKEDYVLIFSAVLAIQIIALNFRVLESFLKVLLEWSSSRENARAGKGELRGKE